jgi:hypothetical protein
MKKNIATILMMTCFVAVSSFAQKPKVGQVQGERVPMYCGSTGSSSADSTRLPILFQAKINGLTPGGRYKYFARFISLNDTSSSTTTGVGTPIILKKNGSWTTISSPDISTSGGHDTISLTLAQSEYTGWFGAFYNNDSRFATGKFIYPMIVFEEIGTGSPQTEKAYITDSIEVLQFSTAQTASKGTAIYGYSFVKAKSIVLLYDNINGTTNRPITVTYSENDGISYSNMQTWYNNKVNTVSGSWGSIIPNNLSSGITRIENRDAFFDTIIYANTEADGIWGNDTTKNRKGGAVKPVNIKSDYAPLLKPEFEFVSNLTTLVEANATVNMVVRRRYGNNDTSKVSAFITAGTATNNVDYTILTSYPLVFKPYGEALDTIQVRVNDDFASEATENVAIRLINPVNGRIGFQTTSSINITDNDIPVITFAKRTETVSEAKGILKVRLKINSGSNTATNVRVLVKSKTDSTFIPSEFKLGSSNKDTIVQFAGGKVVDSLDFNIAIINDLFKEDRSDTLTLVLRNPTSPATIGKDSLFTLIIMDNDAPPIYSFSTKTFTVKENVGSVKIRINKLGGNSNQSDIVLSAVADPKNAQAGSDFTFTGSQFITFTATDPDSFVYTLPILDDNFSEPKEDAVFVIRTAFNAKIGKPDTLRISIVDNDLPEYKINKLTFGKAPNFILDSLNVHCAIRGVVYGVNMGPVGTPNGTSFTVIDNTGGIQVFKGSGGNKGYTVTEGDSVQVYGRVAQVNGMAQLTQLDTILLLGSGRPLRSAKVVSILNESTESNLVKYNSVKLSNSSKWPSTAMAPNTSVTLKVLTANDSFDIVIDSETDIDGKTAPSGFFNVAGLGAQNDATSPYTSGYQLYPRRMSDFTNLVVPTFGFSTPTSIGKENRDSTEGFILQCANLTTNQQINIVIKGGTAARNDDYQSLPNRLFILTQANPSINVKSKINDDAKIELNETIVWVIRDNAWGTLIGPDSIHTVTILDDETPNSILESTLEARTKVYPNPAKQNVTLSSEEALINEVVVYDVNGREVKRFTIEASNKTVLDLEGISNGMYTLSIHTDKGNIVKSLSVL